MPMIITHYLPDDYSATEYFDVEPAVSKRRAAVKKVKQVHRKNEQGEPKTLSPPEESVKILIYCN